MQLQRQILCPNIFFLSQFWSFLSAKKTEILIFITVIVASQYQYLDKELRAFRRIKLVRKFDLSFEPNLGSHPDLDRRI